jgi:antitoxin CcdA
MMKAVQATARSRKATNITLDESLLAEAKVLHINISQAAEAGVARAVAEKRAEQWLAENQEALDSWNAYVEEHGLPLADYRSF